MRQYLFSSAGKALIITALTLLPILGLTDFHTKGEPREAVVAQTMLHTGNWILPQNNGGEFAYKPPMFHWAVAVLSLPQGKVTELTARLPSALAAIITAFATFLFFARRRNDPTLGLLTAIILLTSFEVYRAATGCRVDMLLTMFIVLAIYRLAGWLDKGMHGIPISAVLLMGCGTLTKGPIAILLPCMVTGSYALIRLRHELTLRTSCTLFVKFMLTALASLLLPLLWYWAAYAQGGTKFLYLVYEENVLRFLGKMPYRSHEHGMLYYVYTLPAGLAPWMLPVMLAGIMAGGSTEVRAWTARQWRNLRQGNIPFPLWAIALILLFYLFPKSKRGVYLLPLYPFAAYYIARLCLWVQQERPQILKIFEWILTGAILTGMVAYMVIQTGWIPASLMPESIAADYLRLQEAFRTSATNNSMTSLVWLFVGGLLIAAYYLLQVLPLRLHRPTYGVIAAYLLLHTFVLPPLLNAKSDKPLAETLNNLCKQTKVYSYIDDPTGMMHYFTLNFYTDNQILPLPHVTESARFHTDAAMPSDGLLLMGSKDRTAFLSQHPRYECSLVEDLHHRSCDTHQSLGIYRFQLRP